MRATNFAASRVKTPPFSEMRPNTFPEDVRHLLLRYLPPSLIPDHVCHSNLVDNSDSANIVSHSKSARTVSRPDFANTVSHSRLDNTVSYSESANTVSHSDLVDNVRHSNLTCMLASCLRLWQYYFFSVIKNNTLLLPFTMKRIVKSVFITCFGLIGYHQMYSQRQTESNFFWLK
jgi:hypothetical protein